MLYKYIIELIFGILTGVIMGTTGMAPFTLLMLILEYFNVNEYKTILGSVLLVNLFPITIGSIYEFYKAKKIDYVMSAILILSVTLGSFLGSKLVLNGKNKLSVKTIKYITSIMGFTIGFVFLFSAFNSD
jgi:uncharacterized membrane protein YfcA